MVNESLIQLQMGDHPRILCVEVFIRFELGCSRGYNCNPVVYGFFRTARYQGCVEVPYKTLYSFKFCLKVDIDFTL